MEFNRLRYLRKKKLLRELLQETRLSVKDFVLPLFVIEGKNKKEEIFSMPGVFRFSIDNLMKEVGEAKKVGIVSVLIFGIPNRKDDMGSPAYNENGIVPNAVKKIRQEFPDVVIMTDVCLCSYTIHGHCGILKAAAGRRPMVGSKQKNIDHKLSAIKYQPEIDNDKTIEILAKIALSHAVAGADIVAPSAMMDGQVSAIRKVLDKNGFSDVLIMGYSAKYASSFYGPFREASDSAPQFGDRKSYQMDYHNLKEALREVEADIKEGADIVMVKPALAYLDVIKAVKESAMVDNIPIAAYNVSGEYSMIKAASEKGWLDEKNAVLEILTSIKRAGADIIITYWAKEAARWLKS